MARRVLLHVGVPKAGTTYLQSILWAHQDDLREHGVLVPLAGHLAHFRLFRAAVAGLDESRMGPRAVGMWQRAEERIAPWPGDVVISHEHFCSLDPDEIDPTTSRLAGMADEVHVVMTARDLPRQVASSWQQYVKRGSSWTMAEFLAHVREGDPRSWFWRTQDLPAIVRRWSAPAVVKSLHVVTLPASGGRSSELWQRFARVLAVPSELLAADRLRVNPSLSAVDAEIVRRMHSATSASGAEVRDEDAGLVQRRRTGERLAEHGGGGPPPAYPAEAHPWIAELADTMVAELAGLAAEVTGTLEDLRPGAAPPPGVDPDALDAATIGTRTSDVRAILDDPG